MPKTETGVLSPYLSSRHMSVPADTWLQASRIISILSSIHRNTDVMFPAHVDSLFTELDSIEDLIQAQVRSEDIYLASRRPSKPSPSFLSRLFKRH